MKRLAEDAKIHVWKSGRFRVTQVTSAIKIQWLNCNGASKPLSEPTNQCFHLLKSHSIKLPRMQAHITHTRKNAYHLQTYKHTYHACKHACMHIRMHIIVIFSYYHACISCAHVSTYFMWASMHITHVSTHMLVKTYIAHKHAYHACKNTYYASKK